MPESMPCFNSTINVRSAKAHLSALLEWVSQGREVIITSDGKPKARLVSVASQSRRKTFKPNLALLRNAGIDPSGPDSTKLIRTERDLGW